MDGGRAALPIHSGQAFSRPIASIAMG